MPTNKQLFFKKYSNKLYDKKSLSKKEISKISGVPLSIIDELYDRGIGAYETNPTSVRSKKSFKKDPSLKRTPLSKRLSPQQWAFGRVYGFVSGNPKQISSGSPDRDLYLKLSPYLRRKIKSVRD